MPESIAPPEDGETEPVRLPESDLESIEASVRKLLDQSAEQARQLDSLASAPPPTDSPFGAFGMPGFAGMPPQSAPPEPSPILELEGEEYEDELDALADWVDDFLVRVYGAEVTTAAPWCEQWQEHADVVAWLHALWLAYQQHKDPEAGLSGLFVWHRDFLTHAMATVRAAGGPLSACMTDPDRPAHRLLPGPPPSSRTTAETAESKENGAPGQGAG
ncbi:DUF4913 domain-containing protein [Streptomyces phaeochromogenes]|uniref:DUF4913 domain-containing protein n=1 Tax=Streptomyces phaeochromogenes TaxID=1923 RepID=UPI002DDC6256|nr:DUF4913 domain-containing protein [Streptomyces phaeochromogenes]WRZ34751.1 DUF4913 domain-containing protein [Streptomyces phaeochromogenes]